MSVILCTAGYDHTIRFWDTLSGFCSRQIPHAESQVNRLCISPNKAFVAAAGHFAVKLYGCKGNDPTPIQTFEGHTNNITGLGFQCDTRWMVTSSEDGTVKIWDIKTGTVQRNYNHGCPVNDVVIHPNQGELISCDRGGDVRIWDLGYNRCSHHLIPEDDVSVASVAVASDGSLLCAGNNTGNVYVWRMIQTQGTTSLVPVCNFAAHTNYITRVLLSPDVHHLATCSADHTARIWTVDNGGGLRASFPPSDDEDDDEDDDGPEDRDDDNNEAGSDDVDAGSPWSESLIARDGRSRPAAHAEPYSPQMNTNMSLALQHTHASNPAMGSAYAGTSPQPPFATTTGMNGKTLSTNTSGNTTANIANFNATNNTTGASAPNGVSAREPNAFSLETTLTAHQCWVWDCAFSADSAYLVTACSDHYARLWELGSQSLIRQYNGHHRGVVCVALNDYLEDM